MTQDLVLRLATAAVLVLGIAISSPSSATRDYIRTTGRFLPRIK